jgi:PAS domain S-box-containing protein
MDTQRTKVLLIEDNPGDAQLIRELLAEREVASFDLQHADRLSTGLARLAQGDIDAILLDLSLPDSQGLDSLGKINALASKVPVVVLSGLSDETLAISAVHQGAQDYLVKGDVDHNLLVRSIHYAIERQRMRQELLKSESRYRLLADNAADVIWTADMKWRITYVSPSIKRLLGYTVEEMKRLAMGDILTPDSLEQAGKLIRNQMDIMTPRSQYPSLSLTLEYVRKDGSTLWAEVILSFLWDKDGKLSEVLGVTREITERKKAEEALRQIKERYRELFENANDIIYTHDLAGNFTSINKAGEQVTGYKRDEVLGMNTCQLLTPESLELVRQMASRKVNQGGSTQYELEIVAKDGHRILLEVSTRFIYEGDKPVSVQGIARDITKRKEMERELRQREQDYLILLESTHDSILVVDAETLKVVFANRRAALMFGFDPVLHDGVGVNLLDFVHPEDREIAIKGFVEDVYQRERRQRYDVRAKTKDGREIWVSALATRIEFQGRVAVLLSLRDVTKDRRMEEEKQRLEEELLLAGRLAAIGELAAGVAHELNNPLAAIQGFAQLLTKSNDLNEATKKDLDTIYREAQRAARITQNLLSFARKHKPEKQLISINEALEKTLELRGHEMKGNNIELSVQLQPDLPLTIADFYQVQQVFMNIIINAEQAMVEAHGKGKLVIKTRIVGNSIQITFTDDGPGISEENLDRIFNPFFTTKEVGKGTGLGLSLCHGIVQTHGGRIYAKSKLGKGATFVVEIPIMSEGQAVAERADLVHVKDV